jgi:hypothetical protein
VLSGWISFERIFYGCFGAGLALQSVSSFNGTIDELGGGGAAMRLPQSLEPLDQHIGEQGAAAHDVADFLDRCFEDVLLEGMRESLADINCRK